MHFVAVDFETATAHRHSPCEIGLTVVKNGRVTDTLAWLIKPPQYPHFNGFNVAIHGIRPDDVATAPTFADLWPTLRPYLTDCLLVAHNAAFDVSVLRHTLAHYGLAAPESLRYTCTVQIARQVWSGLENYKLPTLCRHHAIGLQQHHRAGGDAQACAEILLCAARDTGSATVAELEGRGYARVKGF